MSDVCVGWKRMQLNMWKENNNMINFMLFSVESKRKFLIYGNWVVSEHEHQQVFIGKESTKNFKECLFKKECYVHWFLSGYFW